ncbi:M60 family metallopeptidase [Chryseobacterium viscerum]|uniref:Peptidase M60 domain-containing protein n=1 Tax=Chryseobacterium viscerum TaxID=1037377 RepID=A0A316WAP5_9FLAO|nr:M60 family metallopeptidase [Chryseobacterium viscerum]PWN57989.1 hypothetical protein C1634_024935 [Chryseobacterium viscerum]
MKKILWLLCLLSGLKGFSQLIQVPVYSCLSLQPAQSGEEIDKIIDGDNNTMYHSLWSQTGIPDELKFYFTSNVTRIKKLVYTPRQAGGTNGIWTNVSVSYSTQAAPNTFISLGNNIVWAADGIDKEIIFPTAIQNPNCIKISVNAGVGNFSSGAEMKFFSEVQPAIADGADCTTNTSELSINDSNDLKATIIPSGTIASSFQSGEGIDKSYDNDVNTLYHSSYSNTSFPVVLNYRLDGVTPIDYLKYVPRISGNNGIFGNVTISYNTTSNSAFVTLMSFDFQNSNAPVKVYFSNQITPLNVRITVNNGAGNFASCAEMGFYKTNSLVATPYSNVFANSVYSALQPSVTQADINAISSPFYKDLAQCLFNGTYVKKYRVQDYKVYPPVSVTTSNLKIGGGYNSFENPTGIVFAQGDKVAMFVQNISSDVTASLQVKDFSASRDGITSYYQLQNGLNVFQLTNGGLGYISYYNTDSALPDIKVNIVSGKVNGFYHYQTSTQSDWMSNLSNSAYPMMDVIGQHSHLVYQKSVLKNGSALNPGELISKYDLVVKNEWLVMGLYKYNLVPKNRMFAYSNNNGQGWNASDLGVTFDSGWGQSKIADPKKLDLWGIAHEFGHINQIRPDLKWIGTTEVTNNMHSTWVDYHMNVQNDGMSRLERESEVPAPGMTSVKGGRINGALLNTTVNQEALQGNVSSDPFKVLVPFWQLELYYQLAGASRKAPTLSFTSPANYTGIDYANWFGTVANKARNFNASGVSNGELVLNFVKNTCAAVQEDLTGFFTKTGFLRPINTSIIDYANGQLTITQAQIDATIADIQGQNYQNPVSPVIHYISSRSVATFRDHLLVSGQTGQGVTLGNNYLTVQHSVWKNVVAYETFNANNQLIYVSITGTGDITNQTTKVYYPSNAAAVYAVGYDGHKILVYPYLSLSLAKQKNKDSQLTVYPNPVEQNESIHIKLENESESYHANITDADGKSIFSTTGRLETIERAINKDMPIYRSGVYLLSLIDDKNNFFKTVKIIKK